MEAIDAFLSAAGITLDGSARNAVASIFAASGQPGLTWWKKLAKKAIADKDERFEFEKKNTKLVYKSRFKVV